MVVVALGKNLLFNSVLGHCDIGRFFTSKKTVLIRNPPLIEDSLYNYSVTGGKIAKIT